MVCAAQHFKPAGAASIGLEMVMTAGSVAAAVARFAMVHLAVAPKRIAPRSRAAILGPALCRGSGKTPDVFALPCSLLEVKFSSLVCKQRWHLL
jgi:hypothetical protein